MSEGTIVALAVTVKSDVLEPPAGTFTMVGLSVALRPISEVLAIRFTFPVKPPRLVTLMILELLIV